MKKHEYVVPIEYWGAKEILEAETRFLRRSKIEDAYFIGPNDSIARLRRQDTLTRLSCTKKEVVDRVVEAHETIVLDHRATEALLGMLGFKPAENVRLTRDSFRKDRFTISVDRVEELGDFLVLETEAEILAPERLERAAERFIERLEIPLKGLPGRLNSHLDSFSPLPYTRAIGIEA